MSTNPTGYWTDGEVVCRADDTLADIVDGKVIMRPEFERFKIQARKFWKDYQARTITGIMQNIKIEPLHIPSPQDTVTVAGFVKFNSAEVEGDIPSAPPQDPALGSKTPEYWAWLKKFHPEQAEECHKLWGGR
jgi:hypothetical protein